MPFQRARAENLARNGTNRLHFDSPHYEESKRPASMLIKSPTALKLKLPLISDGRSMMERAEEKYPGFNKALDTVAQQHGGDLLAGLISLGIITVTPPLPDNLTAAELADVLRNGQTPSSSQIERLFEEATTDLPGDVVKGVWAVILACLSTAQNGFTEADAQFLFGVLLALILYHSKQKPQ